MSSIDFSGLVLGPCMDAFNRPCTVTPVKSQPMSAPYSARGIWAVDNITTMLDDGGTLATRVLKFGVKLDEFSVPPQQYDMLTFNVTDLPMGYLKDVLDPTSTIDFFVDSVQPDGQGGATYLLRRKP